MLILASLRTSIFLALATCTGADPATVRETAAQSITIHVELTKSQRSCPQLPPPLPPVRTPEALKDREARLDELYRECAERHRQVVEKFDALSKLTTKPGGPDARGDERKD